MAADPAFVGGQPAAPILRAADPGTERLSELLLGEAFAVREAGADWVLGVGADGVEGFVAASALRLQGAVPTHRVRRGAAALYRRPDLRQAAGALLPLNARVALTGRTAPVRMPSGDDGVAMAELESGLWAAAQALAPLDEPETDARAVAMSLVGAPYLHGGRGGLGFDGPGLIQAVLSACGLTVSRAPDAQRAAIRAQSFSLIHGEDACGFLFGGEAVVASISRMQVMRLPREATLSARP